MKVSVIVPVYNVEAYLRECLDSIIAVPLPDMELILVDDASTDSSGAICDSFAAAHPEAMVIHHERNRGLSAARNSGIDAASGDILTFVDSDDILDPSFLTRLSSLMENGNHYDIVSCGMVRFSDSASLPDAGRTRGNIVEYDGRQAVEAMLYQREGISSSMCGKLFRRNLFDGLRFREGILYEDLDLAYRIFLRAGRCLYITAPLYLYRKNPGSILSTFSPRRSDVLDVAERMEMYMSENCPSLLAAASDRSLSAAFNILGLMSASRHADASLEKRCWDMIVRRRLRSLLNGKVRLKNKLGILISYIGGKSLYKLVARKIYKGA